MLRGRAYHICTVSSHFDIFIGEGRSQRLACDAFYHRFPNLRWWSSWKRSLRHLLFFELMREGPPPSGDGKSTSCEISSGRWIPIETKKSRDPKRNMLPSQVSVNLSKGCWDWVQDRRNPLLCRCKMLRTPPGPYGTKLLHFFLLMSKVSPGRQKSLAPKS